jgi:hypothetical protein
VITGGFLQIPTSFAPSTSTLSVQAITAGDLVAAATASSYAAGIHSMIPAYTGASSLQVGTLPVTVKVVIASHALTAGTMNGTIDYFLGTAT